MARLRPMLVQVRPKSAWIRPHLCDDDRVRPDSGKAMGLHAENLRALVSPTFRCVGASTCPIGGFWAWIFSKIRPNRCKLGFPWAKFTANRSCRHGTPVPRCRQPSDTSGLQDPPHPKSSHIVSSTCVCRTTPPPPAVRSTTEQEKEEQQWRRSRIAKRTDKRQQRQPSRELRYGKTKSAPRPEGGRWANAEERKTEETIEHPRCARPHAHAG